MKTYRHRWMVIAALIAVLGVNENSSAQKKIAGPATANQVKLNVALGSPVLLAGRAQKTYLKIGLTGFPLKIASSRAQVNVAIVLDRSGSMSGEKLYKAKEAAIMAIEKLGPDDIVSVVAYNHTVDVLIPATKVGDREQIYARIRALTSDGNTALFAGVSKGSYEVRKFIDRNRVNRVVLLSDGLANVGPSTPGELAALGRSLIKEGMSVTTIGLGTGYNEDLMVALARQSDGNHAFAENATDLARIFNHEFGDVLSVVARDVMVEIRCAPGIRPIRVLGRSAEINGNHVVARLNQIYAKQEKFLMLEVEVPASTLGMRRDVATVDVQYANTVTKSTDMLGSSAVVAFTDSMAAVEKNQDKSVQVASVELIANETNKAAVILRDQGKVEEAERVLMNNAIFLDKKASKFGSKRLKKKAASNRAAKAKLKGKDWTTQRKSMRQEQFAADQQMVWE